MPPKKKKTIKKTDKEKEVKKKDSKSISLKEIEKIRMDFVQGTKRRLICNKYKIDYKTLDNLILRNSWKNEREEIRGKVRKKMDFKILTNSTNLLSRMNTEATLYLNLFKEKILDPNTTNLELSVLIKARNILVKELLRSLGLTDTIHQNSSLEEVESQVTIQIVTGVGEKPGSVEKLIGGRVMGGEKETTNKKYIQTENS
ncbi:hypothetical protein [Leptospira alstonii]|nr:hypothetical protein [Leptospira alstonii]